MPAAGFPPGAERYEFRGLAVSQLIVNRPRLQRSASCHPGAPRTGAWKIRDKPPSCVPSGIHSRTTSNRPLKPVRSTTGRSSQARRIIAASCPVVALRAGSLRLIAQNNGYQMAVHAIVVAMNPPLHWPGRKARCRTSIGQLTSAYGARIASQDAAGNSPLL